MTKHQEQHRKQQKWTMERFEEAEQRAQMAATVQLPAEDFLELIKFAKIGFKEARELPCWDEEDEALQ